MSDSHLSTTRYQRYHIDIADAPDIETWPNRFQVRVKRLGLLKLLLREIIHYRADRAVVLSRPCVYGVFSSPLGGLLPYEERCVGCLRCTTQHPEIVEIRHNPERQLLGDSYFSFRHVGAIAYEAGSGNIPVKGAGYRGRFGGEGWDAMWTDMSEIVRPTRDGIHGREFISTVVDIGGKPLHLTFDANHQPVGEQPATFSIPLPFLFDVPPPVLTTGPLLQILAQAAEAVGSLAILPLSQALAHDLHGRHVAPLVFPDEVDETEKLTASPRLVVLASWDERAFRALQTRFPRAQICLRQAFGAGEPLLSLYEAGVRVFHLTADYHGRGAGGAFVLDLIRAAHNEFVEAGIREAVTLLGSGGIIAAEHVPKAIIAGLDAVALDTPLLVALQARFDGDFTSRDGDNVRLPAALNVAWGRQRLQNLAAAWRDQMLEVLGAMGLREVRRLRGEMGRAIFQLDMEREAFAGIEGFPQ